ncbi:recombinase family protein [Bacillus licheniformis]|uniref:recombinase family protein n=1 Tax=Bacillus TaxID=1386 RepID=UPI0004701111|nr:MULTISPECIES: recombinase family protein [Bacillus]ASK26229.1 DNA recombinase [Bacillus subtilis]MCQ5304565.1 recombinase family protein [Bacillus licheniformis]MDM5287387.1 recombinase family protein [Bacillus licheniformis]MEC0776931.1 recombinase family protein [Bacillus licheniformis]MED1661747.1 recombinase family protein [Bacillus licheniformis]
MSGKKIGYIRVSDKDQNENRQLDSMLQEGIDERDIFIDKQSGRKFERENYKLMKRFLREGDVLYVHELDRFGRNQKEILKEWDDITQNIKADINVMDMPLLDTRMYKDSLGMFVSQLVLQILSWTAEKEYDSIKKRQREGIESAKARNVKFGRPKAEINDDFINVYNRWKAKEITATAAIKELGIGRTTFYKLVSEYEDSKTTDE